MTTLYPTSICSINYEYSFKFLLIIVTLISIVVFLNKITTKGVIKSFLHTDKPKKSIYK